MKFSIKTEESELNKRFYFLITEYEKKVKIYSYQEYSQKSDAFIRKFVSKNKLCS